MYPVKVTNDFLWELGQTNFQRYQELFDWINQNIEHAFVEEFEVNGVQPPYRLFNFRKEEDAINFVLTWL